MAELSQDEPAPSSIPEPPPGPPPLQHLEPAAVRFLRRAFESVIGPARALTDPHLFHKISLAAFLAWVGLGADGLSSSAYGPEAALTGPAVRGDAGTVRRNLEALSRHAPEAVGPYVALARLAADLAAKAGRLSADGYARLREVLDGSR